MPQKRLSTACGQWHTPAGGRCHKGKKLRRRAENISRSNLQEVFDDLKSEYQIGKDTRYLPRMAGVDPAGTGADFHVASEAQFFKGIERARTFDRENMIVGQGVTRLIDNVIQDGFPLEAQTGSEELDLKLWERWNKWCRKAAKCHSRKTLDFVSIAKLTLRSVLVDGDVLHLPLKSGQLQPVEAHRLRTPRNTTRNVIHGVLLDGVGAPVEYWVSDESKNINQRVEKVSDTKHYRAFDEAGEPAAFHVFNPKRFSQTRGQSVFNPCVFPVGIHDDLQFAKLVQAQVVSCFAILRKQQQLPGQAPGIQARGESVTETLSDGSQRLIQGIAPGMEVYARAGEEIEGFSPNVPNAEFFQHALLILCIIAVNIGIPVAVLLLDPTKTNFSGWRGAIDQARIGFKEMQRWMIQRFYSPVYTWKVRQWIAEDEELQALAGAAGVDPLAHEFLPPKWAYIEPYKDAQADDLRMSRNLTSPRRLFSDRGEDWEQVADEIVKDKAYLIRAALREAKAVNDEFPEAKLDWRELTGTERPTSEAKDQEEPEPTVKEDAA